MCGQNSPHYRGTQDPNRGRGWKRIAAGIRERDSHTCQRCGVQHAAGQKAFPVDHIIPWRTFADKVLANDPTNLVTLCMRCHAIKTTIYERKWLKGDRIGMEQYRKALSLPPLFAAPYERD